MGQFIFPDELEPFATIEPARAEAMVEDAEAMAILAAPCLADLPFESPKRASVRAVLRAAILRWHDAGTGAIQQMSAGPFQQSVQVQSRRAMFWPSEITQLQGLCKTPGTGKAYSIDTIPGVVAGGHLPWCNLMMGASYCSCGADIGGGVPLYEGGASAADDPVYEGGAP